MKETPCLLVTHLWNVMPLTLMNAKMVLVHLIQMNALQFLSHVLQTPIAQVDAVLKIVVNAQHQLLLDALMELV